MGVEIIRRQSEDMKTQMLYLLESLNSGKREMLVEYLRHRGAIRDSLEDLNEEHATFLLEHLKDVLSRAKAHRDPEEAFHDLATEVLE